MERGSMARTLAGDPIEGRAWQAGTATAAPPVPSAAGLAGASQPDGLETWYVVVDELLDGAAVVHVTPWPVVDARGRLRFPARERGFTARADAARLRALADASGRIARPLRVGDVFRARFAAPARGSVGDFCDLLGPGAGGPPLSDVSREARESAKAQATAALAPVLDEAAAWELYRDLAPPR